MRKTCLLVYVVLIMILINNNSSTIYAATQGGNKESNQPSSNLDKKALEILDKLFDTYEKLESYSYTNFKKGLDTYAKDAEKQLYEDAAKQGKSVKVEKSSKEPVLKEGEYFIEFLKPYILQMKIIKSDFTPKLLFGSLCTYRSDKSTSDWWFKIKYSPFALKRSVKDEDGGFLTQGWTQAITTLKLRLNKVEEMKIKSEDEEVEGVKCSVIEVKLKKDYVPSKEDKAEINKYIAKLGVPKEIQEKVSDNILGGEEEKVTDLVEYWIDKDRHVLVKIIEYISGEFYWQNYYKDIKLNNLTEKDF